MKVLILSDIHGNIDGLKAVVEAEKDCDAILCVGDLVDWGFYPHEVIAYCQEHNMICVKGNHDHEVLDAVERGVTFPTDGTPYDFQQYTIGHLSKEDLEWLRAVPDERLLNIDGLQIYMTHYSPRDIVGEVRHVLFERLHQHAVLPWCDEEWTTVTGNPVSHFERRVFLFGHTHESVIIQPGCGYQIVNPGSISYRLGPNSESKGADYIVMENGFFTQKHVDYPVEHLFQVIQAQNFDLNKDIFRQAYIYYGVQS